MFTGGIDPYSYYVNPSVSQNNSSGSSAMKPQAIPLLSASTGPGWASLFGNATPAAATQTEPSEMVGTLQTMMTSLFEQFGISGSGQPESDSTATESSATEEEDSEDDKADEKWKNMLKQASQVQDNVEAVKVAPADDSGYYSSLSCYSDS